MKKIKQYQKIKKVQKKKKKLTIKFHRKNMKFYLMNSNSMKTQMKNSKFNNLQRISILLTIEMMVFNNS